MTSKRVAFFEFPTRGRRAPSGRAVKDQSDLIGAEHAPLTQRQFAQRKSTNRDALQRLDVIAGGREHPPYLVVATFRHGKAGVTRSQHLKHGWRERLLF